MLVKELDFYQCDTHHDRDINTIIKIFSAVSRVLCGLKLTPKDAKSQLYWCNEKDTKLCMFEKCRDLAFSQQGIEI